MQVRIGQPRRRGRWIVAGAIAAAAGVILWVAAHWWPTDHGPGWTGTQQAATVADIVGAGAAVLGLAVALLAWLRPRPMGSTKAARLRGLQVVGRVPPPAARFQPREVGKWLAQAAGSGRTVVLTQVISGMGGVGKTQLAAEFARRLADQGKLDLLVWITASRPDAIVDGYAEVAGVLGLADAGEDASRAAQRFVAWAERTDRRWLLVLDDLAQPADLAGWWPAVSVGGRVLVTTRRRDAALGGQSRVVVDVDLFTAAEARTYLRQVLPAQPEADFDRLATELGRLPLALAQAAAYMRDRGLSCDRYLTRFADRRRNLACLLPEAQALPDEQRAPVAATWQLSIEAADELHPQGLARPVLELASVLDPNGIPAAVFITPPVIGHLATVVSRQVTAEDAWDALRSLHRLSLLTVDGDDVDLASVRVHGLVQRATRDEFPDQRLSLVTDAAALALLHLWPYPEPDTNAAATLRANAVALYAHTGDALLASPQAYPVLFRAGTSLGGTGQVTAARDHFQHLLEEVRQVLGPDHPNTLLTRGALAQWRYSARDRDGAAEALQQLLDDQQRVLGPDHPDTLTTRGLLAGWLGLARTPLGNQHWQPELVADLLADHARVLDDLDRVLGPDHPNTLATRRNLAYQRGISGDPAGAAEALLQLLDDRQRVLGPDHPDTLATRSDLAFFRGMRADPAGAAEALQQLLDDQQRVLGPDHPDTLTTRRQIVYERGRAGDPAEAAVEALQQLLDDQQRVLGPDHPDTQRTQFDLAHWHRQAGNP